MPTVPSPFALVGRVVILAESESQAWARLAELCAARAGALEDPIDGGTLTFQIQAPPPIEPPGD